jgi:hypothetical protein
LNFVFQLGQATVTAKFIADSLFKQKPGHFKSNLEVYVQKPTLIDCSPSSLFATLIESLLI